MDGSQLEGFEKKLIGAARIVIGFVFLWASVNKIVDPGSFARSVANYQLLPEAWVNLFAVVLPWVELLCGLFLLFGQWTRTSALVVAGLLFVFMVAVGINMIRGLDVHCGCFDASSGRKIGLRLLLEDAFYIILALFLVFRGRDALGWEAFRGQPANSTTVTPSPPSPGMPGRKVSL